MPIGEDEPRWRRSHENKENEDPNARIVTRRKFPPVARDGSSQCCQPGQIRDEEVVDLHTNNDSSYTKQNLEFSGSWKGKQKRKLARKRESISKLPHILVDETCKPSLAQKLQELLEKDKKRNALEDCQNSESGSKQTGLLLAQRLQELLDGDPQPFVPNKQRKGQTVHRKHTRRDRPYSTNARLRSGFEDDIMEIVDSDNDPQGQTVERKHHIPGNKTHSRNERRRSSLDDDIMESFDIGDDAQAEESLAETLVRPSPNIWEQFQDGFDCYPENLDTTIARKYRNNISMYYIQFVEM